MKFIYVLMCFTLSQSAKLQQDFNSDWLSDEYIAFVQSQAITWKAGRNFHRETPIKNLVKRLGYVPIKRPTSDVSDRPEDLPEDFQFPENFDARVKWPNCPTIKEIRDQGSCGSCWAIASVEVMTDRTCILSKGKHNFHYSTEDLMSCCSSCGYGCDGGYPYESFQYWKHHGIVSGGLYNSSDGCMPYKIAPCEHYINGHRPNCDGDDGPTPKCERKCESSYATSYENDLHMAKDAYEIDFAEDAMHELAVKGPITAAFDVYSDFLSYKSGVYQLTSDSTYLGGHAIRIIGYGSENGVPYWLCANSWNYDWGDQGLFKILRGKNECGIEGDFVAGTPKF